MNVSQQYTHCTILPHGNYFQSKAAGSNDLARDMYIYANEIQCRKLATGWKQWHEYVQAHNRPRLVPIGAADQIDVLEPTPSQFVEFVRSVRKGFRRDGAKLNVSTGATLSSCLGSHSFRPVWWRAHLLGRKVKNFRGSSGQQVLLLCHPQRHLLVRLQGHLLGLPSQPLDLRVPQPPNPPDDLVELDHPRVSRLLSAHVCG